ncbi:MAG TPA: hypothetical protein VEA38_02770 [Terriglobales bacterium]|nr:hypothetical protein [Terriglobales bacterium]
MRFFRREIELTLKMLGVVTLVGLIVLPVAWGYEQRRQARTWQNVACAYRIKEVTRNTPLVASVERAPDACTTLARLGLQVSEGEFVVLPATAANLTTRTR